MKNYKLILLSVLILFCSANTYAINANVVNITSPIVPQYHKFEVGIDINKVYTNPYDPSIISVEAHFISPTGKEHVVYGFYYIPYSRLDVDSLRNGIVPTYSSVFWRQESTNYNWRVRFAPNEIGTWEYYIVIVDPDTEPFTTTTNSFACTESEKHGFLKTSLNKRFLEFSDATSFFGKGEDHRSTTSENQIFLNWPSHICSNECYTKGTLLKHLNMLWNLSNSNGNYVRLWLEPYGFDPEWEKLNDYSGRQNRMSDFDILIDESFRNDVYIHLVLLGEQVFKIGSDRPYYADWNFNPYKIPGETDLPIDFLTNQVAQNAFKNKLRYIQARWGYSTAIAAYSLFNEPDFLSNGTNPGDLNYFNIRETSFKDWQIVMADFLKNNSYPRHLVTCDYAFYFENDIEKTNTFDFTNTHVYGWDKNIEYQRAYLAKRNNKIYDKPFNITESGFNAANCQFSIWYYQEFHNLLWASIFHGSFSNSMFFGAESKYQHYLYGGNFIEKYRALSNFLEDETFNTYPDFYKPISNALSAYNFYNNPNMQNCPPPDVPIVDRAGYAPIRSSLGHTTYSPPTQLFNLDYLGDDMSTNFDDKLQVFGLRKNKKIIGWIHLKDAYWYNIIHAPFNFDQCISDGATLPLNDPNTSCSPQNSTTLVEQDFNNLQNDDANIFLNDQVYITINNLECRGRYSVRWYSTHENFDIDNDGDEDDGGEITRFSQQINVDDSRTAVIEVPRLQFFKYSIPNNDPYAEDYAFKLTLIDVETNNDAKWRHSYADAYDNEIQYVDGHMTTDMNGHIFYRDIDGNMSQLYWVDNIQDYNKTTFSFDLDHKIMSTSKIQVNELDDVFYIGEDNSLHFYHWNGNQWNHNYTNDYQNIKLSGSFYVTQNSHVHFRRSSSNSTLDGNLDHYYWDGTQYIYSNKVNLSYNQKVAVESPIIVNSRNDVFYKANSGTLQYFHWDGNSWVHNILNNNLIHVFNQYVDGNIFSYEDKIVYRMPSGYLGLIYWNNTLQDYSFILLPNSNAAFKAALTTDIAVTTNDEIFYKGEDGMMHYYYNNGTNWVHAYADSKAKNLQVTNSIVADNNGKIFYTTDYNNQYNYGHLGQFWNSSQNTFLQSGLGDWYTYPEEFKVSENVTPIVVNNRGHVFYQGLDGGIQYYYWKNFCDNTSNRGNAQNVTNVQYQSLRDNNNEIMLLKCFPNPFINELTIELKSKSRNVKNATLCITDVLGNTKLFQNNVLMDNNQMKTDLSSFNPGVYFVHFSIDGVKAEIFKIIKYIE